MTQHRFQVPVVLAVISIGMAFFPFLGLPAFYDSFFYIVFYWVSLATSWTLLSGFAGYFSLGHAAYLGAGMYTSATLAAKFGWPYLATIPVAALVAASLGCGVGALVFRLPRLRGELFALMTLAVTFILATVILNTPIDGGSGVFLSAVPPPQIVESQSGSIYMLGLFMCMGSLAIAWWVSRSKFGKGLFAIHDDEDVAEAKGVPTYRYKMMAIALSSGIAGAVGGVHAIYVGFLTVAETFGIAVPLSVILMSVLGGARHWLGPAFGATLITVALFGLASSGQTILGRAVVAAFLIIAVLWLPEGIVPTFLHWLKRRQISPDTPNEGARSAHGDDLSYPLNGMVIPEIGMPKVTQEQKVILEIHDVHKLFGGVHALAGATLQVYEGEILGLIGPNGCGKTTLMNMISGHFALNSGTIKLDGALISGLPAHETVQRGLARTYQIPRPFAHMTALENVELCALFGGINAREANDKANYWLEFCGLQERAHVLPVDLNLRERKVLELARALVTQPRVLLLDEVMSGLNPTEVDTAIRLVRQIRAQGTTIVFVEHLMRAVVQLSDRIAVMNEGKVLMTGLPEQVMHDPQVKTIYFGQ